MKIYNTKNEVVHRERDYDEEGFKISINIILKRELEKIRKGIEPLFSFEDLDLSDFFIHDVNFDTDLNGVNFENSILERCYFGEIEMKGINFTNTVLKDVVMEEVIIANNNNFESREEYFDREMNFKLL